MSFLEFSYQMEISFSMPVIKHCFSLRCLPFDNDCQKISNLTIDISPQNILTKTTDGFGNSVLTDRIIEPHTEFYVKISGNAEIDLLKQKNEELNGIFKYQSQYTKMGNNLLDFCKTVLIGDNAKENAINIMKSLHEKLAYKSFVTNVNTTAENAIILGAGVCQDFSHILIAACRHFDIPARYVVGIIKGVGETHAWVEIFDNGKWIGIDPTNNRLADDCYLKISHGRDFADCSVNRGMFIGGGTQTQKVIAKLKQI
ncbi:MAG: transglutaminase family protein [Oscillospiraceae bacterium]